MAVAVITAGVTSASAAGTSAGMAIGTLIEVAGFRFSGNTVFSDAALRAVVDDGDGSPLTLAQLEQAAEKISRHYQNAGYIGSQAYIPPQHVTDSVVEIAIVEARYGKVSIRNESRLQDGVIQKFVAPLQPGDVVDASSLRSAVSNLSSLSGVRARSALAPGSAAGASDVIVTVTDTDRMTGHVDVSNAGTRLTGNVRAGATIQLNNVSGHGDRLSAQLTTGGNRFTHGRVGYEFPVGTSPLWLGASYATVQYKLGEEFAAVDAHGRTGLAQLTARTPFRDGAPLGLNEWRVELAHKRLEDHLSGSVDQKQLLNVSASVDGGHTGMSAQGRAWQGFYDIGLTAGSLTIETPAVLAVDAATLKTNGSFQKLNGHYSFATTFTTRSSLSVSTRGQLAFKNLNQTEKFSLGGPAGVRAYPVSEAAGDDGIIVTAEYRWRHTVPAPHAAQGFVFADVGHVRLHKQPHDAAADERMLYGAGVGAAWSWRALSASAQYAWRLGPELATSDTDSGGRLWLQMRYQF